MKVYVACDLEGTAGVVDHLRQCCWEQSRAWKQEWFAHYLDQARRLATLELNSLVEGCIAGGATRVVAWDGHGNFPGGLDVELLHPECEAILGAGDGGPEGLDSTFDAFFQCGLHAMGGTPAGVLAHGFDDGYWVDGSPVGEIWMNCYTAGRHGVPAVFLAGDRAACEEARAIVPEMTLVPVKEGLSEAAGGLRVAATRSLAPARARALIRQAASAAMVRVQEVAPFRPAGPFHLRVRLTDAAQADDRAAREGAVRTAPDVVEMHGAAEPWMLL